MWPIVFWLINIAAVGVLVLGIIGIVFVIWHVISMIIEG